MSDAKGVLVLEDGARFEGLLFGAPVPAASLREFHDQGHGEVVFNTSMTGYQEILTDPSYYGEIVCMTYPHIGNTGVNSLDVESSKPWCAGLLVHEVCEEPSNWRSEGDLNSYLKTHGIPGLKALDTRALTRHLRSRGVVRGLILPLESERESATLLRELPAFDGRDLIAQVSTPHPYRWKGKAGQFKVVALDYGIKWNLLRSLEEVGCEIEVVPAATQADQILAMNPNGVFLSNGPGDPSAAPYAADTVSRLLGKVPIFGVCMGHQILALALGGRTFKLKFGHRGGNQPVLDQQNGRVEISSHNHGFAVAADSLPADVVVTHMNLNDRTVEGLACPGKRAFSVQYHPEACPGPHDSVALFARFIDLMNSARGD